MTDSITHPAYCQSCEDYYEYVDGLCWQCYHEAQADKAEAAAAEPPEESDHA